VESAVLAAGLDPYVGFLHDADRGAPSLALDLMEEFRPAVVDRLVMRLVNRQQLRSDDFRHPLVQPELVGVPPDGDAEPEEPAQAVYLQDEGRSLFMREFNLLWRNAQLYSVTWKSHTLADILRMQAYAVVRAVENPAQPYVPFELYPVRRSSSASEVAATEPPEE
jgi:CRISPR-associated protein Cas1